MKKSHLPKVAIVGRMNAGKSTLFNRLTESRKAIVSSWAGTTRDENHSRVVWQGREFDVVDTGGLDVVDDEQLEDRVIAAAMRAKNEADIVVFVVDGHEVLPQDITLAKMLRDETDKPVLLAINKMDNAKAESDMDQAVYKLNINPQYIISAHNGRGTGDLLDGIFELLGDVVPDFAVPEHTALAIVGRPNVGKSSFVNAILGEDRVIVADKEHTTRDTNDIPYTYKDRNFLLIDTAGMRRKGNVGKRWSDRRLGTIEKASVGGSLDSMHRADVVVLVIEADKRVTAQDKKIAQLAVDYGKGIIIVVNKWDLIPEKDSNTIDEFRVYFDQSLPFLRWAPMIFTSATERLRVKETLDLVTRVAENYERVVDQETLNTLFARVTRNYKPRVGDTRKYKKTVVKFKTFEQIASAPPRFFMKVDKPKDVPKAIIDITERELRDTLDFEGVKIIIEVDK